MVDAQRWDPARYRTYADERGRPFTELLARVPATAPRTVVDLGSGPGNLTGLLKLRWPDAGVTGLDSSPDMVEATRGQDDGVSYDVADLRDWAPAEPVDVLVSNATLQWVPGHLDLLPSLIAEVAPGGWFALQVPGNFDQPSHTIRRALEAEAPYFSRTAALASPSSHDPETYLRILQPLASSVDAWETTYLHVLTGADPVFDWISGTSLQPTLQALDDELRPRFEAELRIRLRDAYPDDGHGVVLPFRRVFAVARKPAA
ncbi:MAG: methyltransferase domain-containing protein [Marmoricola sp.]